jgi:6-phosphofructokinase 1
LEGPNGILPFLRKRVQEQKYAVVVVAEGAGEELLGVSNVLDAGGNRALPEIGPHLKQVTQDYFAKVGEKCTIKYIDPSYTVRTVPANGADSLYCQQLAMDAVHGCMAGKTGFTVGSVNKRGVLIPIPLLVASSPRTMNPFGTTWERILAMTGQPNNLPPEHKDTEIEVELEASKSSDSSSSTEERTVVFESGLPESTAH